MDAITKRVRKLTVRERTKKAYTDPIAPQRFISKPRRKCDKCGRGGPILKVSAKQLADDAFYYIVPGYYLKLL